MLGYSDLKILMNKTCFNSLSPSEMPVPSQDYCGVSNFPVFTLILPFVIRYLLFNYSFWPLPSFYQVVILLLPFIQRPILQQQKT